MSDFIAQGMAAAAANSVVQALPGIYLSNFSAKNRRLIQLIKAKYRAGNDIYVGMFGTSTSTGRGAGTGSFGITGARTKSTHYLLSNFLNTAGYQACPDAIISTNNYGSSGTLSGTNKYLDYNPAVTVGSSVWSADNNATVGGLLFINASAGDTGALTLTPSQAFNTVDIIYSRASGNGLMTLDIAGGTVTDVNANNATADVYLQTITTGAAAAVQAINVKRKVAASTGNFRMVGLIPRNSAIPKVNLLCLGWSGGQSSDFVGGSSPFSPLQALTFLGTAGRLDLVFIKAGENDIYNNGAGTPVAASSFQSRMAQVIAAAQAGGALVILETIAPQNTPRDPTGAAAAYNAAVVSLAAQYDCPLLDVYQLYGNSYTAANAAGLMFDDVHSLTKGYVLESNAQAQLFMSA